MNAATNESETLLELPDSEGQASGIEREVEDADKSIDQPFDPEQIDVVTRTMTVDLLMSRIDSGAIDLAPDFQRRAGIWTDERQSRLIESLLLRIPLPTLYAAEDELETWAIVDGIQRLTTIARFITPKSIRAQPLVLKGLEYLSKEFDGAIFTDLPPRLQRRMRETELVVHVIRHGTPEEIKFNIFARINTGGMPLSSQELRHALIPGGARDLLHSWADSEQFKEATGYSIRDDRMADRELVLRYIAFRLISFRSYSNKDFDDFLRRAMRDINSWSKAKVDTFKSEFLSSMTAAKAIFGIHAFRKMYRRTTSRYPINKAIFEAVAVNLGMLTEVQRGLLVARKDDVIKKYIELMNTTRFESAVSQGTGDPSKVRTRFGELERIFKEILA